MSNSIGYMHNGPATCQLSTHIHERSIHICGWELDVLVK